MIDIRLNDRAQATLIRGLAALSELIRSAEKAQAKAYLTTEEHRSELAYIAGDGDRPGLTALISGVNRDLFEGALKDDKQRAIETIERMPPAVIHALGLIGGELAGLDDEGEESEVIEPVVEFVLQTLAAIPRAIHGVTEPDALDWASRRAQIEKSVVSPGVSDDPGYLLALLASTALAQAIGLAEVPETVPGEAGPEQGELSQDEGDGGDEAE